MVQKLKIFPSKGIFNKTEILCQLTNFWTFPIKVTALYKTTENISVKTKNIKRFKFMGASPVVDIVLWITAL